MLWATVWVLRIKPCHLTQATDSSNHWEIAPVSTFTVDILSSKQNIFVNL